MGAAGERVERIWRSAYVAPEFVVDAVDLDIDLALPLTTVSARLELRRAVGDTPAPLHLDGGAQQLVEIELDSAPLSHGRWHRTRHGLEIDDVPARCTLTITARLQPADNPGLEGLNHRDGIFFTHCEPEGFRRIAFFPDRPDIFARYRCRITADRESYPLLLANGELQSAGELAGGRHYAVWVDPHPKASYVFALVAGQFAVLRDTFVTRSGRRVSLGVHACDSEIEHCSYGLAVLKEAMRWDEQAYGFEYDLDTLNIAVIRNYPGGAMEHKGLNIYTSELFLASEKLTTDATLRRVRAMVAHEYFHNWTGNRVGLKSWFELSLKEGFTIYRQQQFMAAGRDGVIARIDDIERLREVQFPEDDGAIAHPVRPESYIEISNFYNATVYEKGAELIRMLHAMVGDTAFAAGVAAFVTRHDGSGARIEDLIDAVEAQCGKNLNGMRRWYEAAGAVHVDVECRREPASDDVVLTFRQVRSDGNSQPLSMPIRFGFIGTHGEPLSFRRDGARETEAVMLADETQTRVTCRDLPAGTIPSVFRGLSAPVRPRIQLSDRELATLARSDVDAVNRWDSAQRLAERAIDGSAQSCVLWLELMERVLAHAARSPALSSRLLQLPTLRRLVERNEVVDLDAIAAARTELATTAATAFRRQLRALRDELLVASCEPEAIESRRLRTLCSWYLQHDAEEEDVAAAWRDWRECTNIETAAAAMRLLLAKGGAERDRIVAAAYARWRDTPLLLDLWYIRQAEVETASTAIRFSALVHHREFSLDHGTRVKTAFDAFTHNLIALHAGDGAGYRLIGWVVARLNRPDPRLAARFLKRLSDSRRFDARRRARLRTLFEEVLEIEHLAPNLYEIATRNLAWAREP